MATNKYTSRDFLNDVLALSNLPEHIETYAKNAIAKLDEKNAKKKATPTKAQAENANIKAAILAGLTPNNTYTAKAIADAHGISTQKVSALCAQLVADGALVVIDGYKPEGAKSKVKGYRLADEGS